jgi:hypothetical protein
MGVINKLFSAGAKGLTKTAKYSAGLGAEGAYSLWNKNNLSGKVLRGGIGFGAYYGLGQLGGLVVDKSKESARAKYGLTESDSNAFDAFGSVVRLAGVVEGAAHVIGASHLQRLTKIPGDLKNILSVSKRRKYDALDDKAKNARRYEYTTRSGRKLKPETIDRIRNNPKSTKRAGLLRNNLINKKPPGTMGSIKRLGTTVGQLGFATLATNWDTALPAASTLMNWNLGGIAAVGSLLTLAGTKMMLDVGIKGTSGLKGVALEMGLGAGAFVAGSAIGMSSNMYPAAEGRIESIGRQSAVDKMNFSTAGLTLALHNRR